MSRALKNYTLLTDPMPRQTAARLSVISVPRLTSLYSIMAHSGARMVLIAYFLTGILLADAQPAANQKQLLAFRPAGSNEFTFDTGALRGKLRAKGLSTGLSEVIYVATGTRLDASMGLLSHYRVFSANKRYGTAAWDWPSEASLGADGSVSVRWSTSAEHPFELGATYRWTAPNILDVETRVRARTNLTRFESFLASYWSAAFTNSLVEVRELPHRPGESGLLAAEKAAGQWQAFPRDNLAVNIIRDGRWKFEPNPVDWTIMPLLSHALGVRCAPVLGVTAILMSPPTDCFAISTPYQDEGHHSMYLSLFGGDLKPDEIVRARTRLVIAGRLPDLQVLKTYETYMREYGGR